MIVSKRRWLSLLVVAVFLTACSSGPVALGSRLDGPPPIGKERAISAEACGFQLLLVIPISVNGRAERAYEDLLAQAAGDFIVDVEVAETWTYAAVGTVYCTQLRAKAIHKAT